MSIYETVLRGRLFGQLTINRWNYVSSGDPGTAQPAFELFNKMGWVDTAGDFDPDTIARAIQDLVGSAFHFETVQVRNLFDTTDFYEAFFLTDPVGGNPGDCNTPFMAFGLVSTQTDLAIAKGHKRLAGVTEASVGDGGTVSGAPLTALALVATFMSQILNSTAGGGDIDYSPAVLSKEKYLSHTAPDRYSYKLYADEATQLEHTAVGVSWSPMLFVRSQTSRQYNRGA